MLSQFWIMVRWQEWESGQILYVCTLGRPPPEPISLLGRHGRWYQRQTPGLYVNHLHTSPHRSSGEAGSASLGESR